MELQLRLPGDWPAREHARESIEPDADDLESVLLWLQEAEINAWIQTTPPSHIAAGVHDPYGGEDIRRDFYSVRGAWPRGKIACWLLNTARYHYLRARP